jgi:hypothetical protein
MKNLIALFVVRPVVARPIQDLSAVSITRKTVGIGLPRLWCGAIGLVSSALRISQNGCLLYSSPLYMRGLGWLRHSVVFESAMKTEPKAEPAVKF